MTANFSSLILDVCFQLSQVACFCWVFFFFGGGSKQKTGFPSEYKCNIFSLNHAPKSFEKSFSESFNINKSYHDKKKITINNPTKTNSFLSAFICCQYVMCECLYRFTMKISRTREFRERSMITHSRSMKRLEN